MIQVKYIEKIRDKNNQIISYRLVDKNKNEVLVASNKLKEAIRSCQIEVVNLTLTSDNRLIDKKTDTPSKSNINVEAIIIKAKVLGHSITTFDTDCGHKCYMTSSPDNTKHFLIIPDNVKYLYGTDMDPDIHAPYMPMIKGDLKVIGGRGLTSAHHMFALCKARSIDLSSFDTSKVTNMSFMFMNCEAQSIDLSSFDTRKVTGMRWMFMYCKAHSIDLSSFNTSKVEDMEKMFCRCEAQSIDLSSFDTSEVTDMEQMFKGCKARVKVNDAKLKEQLKSRR